MTSSKILIVPILTLPLLVYFMFLFCYHIWITCNNLTTYEDKRKIYNGYKAKSPFKNFNMNGLWFVVCKRKRRNYYDLDGFELINLETTPQLPTKLSPTFKPSPLKKTIIRKLLKPINMSLFEHSHSNFIKHNDIDAV